MKDFEDFSPELWKKFYPNEESFFIYDEGDVMNSKIIYKNDLGEIETYIGGINQNKQRNGFGKAFSKKRKRIGTWRKNEFTGWGREIRNEKEVYEGRFIYGQLTGKGFYKKDNIFYIGDYNRFIKHGKGDLYTKKYHYKGYFKHNKFFGKGRIEIYEKGIYEGSLKENEFTGEGVYKMKNGGIYQGQIKKGEMDGYGQLITKEGLIYEGTFKNGLEGGSGIIIYPDGSTVKGKFNKGMLLPENSIV